VSAHVGAGRREEREIVHDGKQAYPVEHLGVQLEQIGNAQQHQEVVEVPAEGGERVRGQRCWRRRSKNALVGGGTLVVAAGDVDGVGLLDRAGDR